MCPRSPSSRPSRIRRGIGLLGVLLLAAAALVGTEVLVEHLRAPRATAPVDPNDGLATATLTAGSLDSTERIDGTLVLSSSTDVVHRIDGEESSSVVGSASAGGAVGSAPGGASSLSSNAAVAPVAQTQSLLAVVAGAVALDPCAAASEPTTSTTSTVTTTTAEPSTTTLPSAPSGTPPGPPPGSTPTSLGPLGFAASDPASTTTLPCTTDTSTTTSGATATSVATTADPGMATTTIGPASAPAAGAPTGGAPTGGAPTGAVAPSPVGSSSSTGTATRATQTITSVIAAGSTIELGDVLYTVDGEPVIALTGDLPAWRSLDVDSDDGIDVLQLETSLAALGYDPDGTMAIDTTFDDDTESVVEAWQAGSNAEVTGVVTLGSVVFLAGTEAPTVSSVAAHVGDEVGDGDQILTLAEPAQSVVIDVPTGTESFIVPGLDVQVGSVDATVTMLRSVSRNGSAVVQAIVAPSASIEGASNGDAVTVTVQIDGLDDVVLAPAEAIASRLDGSYALQVLRADGTDTWVTIDLLGSRGSEVGVRGDGIDAGTTVLMAD